MTSAAPAPRAPDRAAADARSWRGAQRMAPRRLVGAIGLSAVLHVLVIAGFVLRRTPPRPPSPPVYRVDLVAAPPGAPAIGAVATEPPPAPTPAPAAAAPAPAASPKVPDQAPETPAAAPPRPETRPRAMPLPTPTKAKPAPPVATPVPPSKAKPAAPPPRTDAPAKPTTTPKGAVGAKPTTAPKAGDAAGRPGATGPTGPRAAGGAAGGRGADVANVHIAGLEFPYPGYLQNIVRQVRLRFTPSGRAQALQADVSFLIHRDGSVSDVRIVRKSGDYGFDLEARGAIETSGQSGAFGRLPDAFHGDVLPVTFSFDPSVIR